jgi:hypothetical protein
MSRRGNHYDVSIFPHGTFVSAVRILKQMPTIFMYNIHLVMFVMETHRVLCEVRTELYIQAYSKRLSGF